MSTTAFTGLKTTVLRKGILSIFIIFSALYRPVARKLLKNRFLQMKIYRDTSRWRKRTHCVVVRLRSVGIKKKTVMTRTKAINNLSYWLAFETRTCNDVGSEFCRTVFDKWRDGSHGHNSNRDVYHDNN